MSAARQPLGMYIPALVLGLSVLNVTVSSLSILVDSLTLLRIHTGSYDKKDHVWNASVISGMMLLIFHISLTLIQIYYGGQLFNAVRERDYVKCRNWFFTSINIYCVEFILYILIAFLASNVEPFLAFTILSIVYKFVQLWPIDGFIENLASYTEPLMGDAAEFHI